MTDWLIDTLVWTSVLMLLVLLVREPVRRQFGAKVAYALWLLPATRLLMPTLTHTVERATPASAPVPLASLTAPTVSLAPESAPLAALLPGEAVTRSGEVALSVASPAAASSLVEQLGGWPVLLAALWLAGAGALFVDRMLDYARERRLILAESAPAGKIGSIRIVRSGAVEGPLAFGIVDRVIAVPDSFFHHYTASERRLALEHELAHHRSGDLVANLFAFVLLSLQWFNPLAWTSYAAFRFDQEAACDARVLDRSDDRAAYGRAIAKAASGRALMFASALDSKSTLKRRLNVMMKSTPKSRRRAGNLLVLGCVAAALPLTATKAVEYVQATPAPVAPIAGAAPKAMPAPLPVAAPVAIPVAISASAPVVMNAAAMQDSRHIVIEDGRPYSQMTSEEREAFDVAMVELREALEEIRVERVEVGEEIAREIAEAREDIDREEIQRELAEARAEIAAEMTEIEANRAELIEDGVDPDMIKASLQAAMASVEAIDVDGIVNGAFASVNPEAIQASVEASLAAAESSIRMSLKKMEEQRRQ